MSKRSPGSKAGMKIAKAKYTAERERARQRRKNILNDLTREHGHLNVDCADNPLVSCSTEQGVNPTREVDNAETVVVEVAESHQNSEQPAGCLGAPVRSPQGAEKGDSSE